MFTKLNTEKNNKKKYLFLKRIFRFLIGVLVFLLLMILFIRSSWGQNIIINEFTNYVSDKTNTKFEVDKAFITFNGNLKIDGLFLEDKKGDTLVYSKSLEANLPLLEMIRGTAFGVDDLKWNGLKANIIRKDTISGYNFQFLIDAFASEKSNEKPTKDTTVTASNIVIGNVNLTEIDVNYIDIPSGIESANKVGQLSTSVKKIDVTNMVFEINEIYLSNSKIKYIQKPVEQTSKKPSRLPYLSAENIKLKNANVYYEDVNNQLITDLNIVDFSAIHSILDANQNIFNIDEIALKKSKITVKTKTSPSNTSPVKKQFQLPNLTLQLGKIDLQNNAIHYLVDDAVLQTDKFNVNAIAIQKFNLNASSINYKNKSGGLVVNTFNFKESSGLNLDKFTFSTTFSNQKLALNNLYFSLNKNSIKGNVKLHYKSISEFINAPEKTTVFADIPSITFNLKELLKLQPTLRNNAYINTIYKKPTNASIAANGTLSKINLTNATINWGNTSKVAVNGTIHNVSKPKLLKVNLADFKAKTTKNDVLNFVNEDSLGLNFPKQIKVFGSLEGSLDMVKANLKLHSTQGNIEAKGEFKNKKILDYHTEINIKNYKVDELLNNNQLGEISLDFYAKGSGKTINNLDAILEAKITDFKLKNYALKDVNIKANLKKGKGNLTSNYKDKNLNINLDGMFNLDTTNTKATVNVDVIGADLEALGFMQRKVKAGMDISLNFNGNLEKYKINTNVKNGTIVYDNRSYLLGEILSETYIDKDTTAFVLKNKMIEAKLQSNASPTEFSEVLQHHISSYFYRDFKRKDTILNPVELKLQGKIAQTTLLKEVFLVNVKDVDTINIAVHFNEMQRKLNANITAPHINYSGNELDSLAFTMSTDQENFNFKLGFKDIKANPLYIPKTVITGNQVNNELSLNFSGMYKADTLLYVNSKITGSRDSLQLSVNSKNLILNKRFWSIPASNKIVLQNNKLQFTDFKITKANQSIEITDKLDKITKEHVAIDYNNFKINEIFNYLNPNKEVATGVLSGQFVLQNPFKNTGIIADLSVNQLKFLKTDFGKLSINGKSLGDNTYDFNATLKEGDIDVDVTGDYFVQNKDANLNLSIQLNTFKMKALNTLSLGEIKETSGSFSGNFTVDGTTAKPNYNGNLNFKDATFNITKLNTKFTLKDEKLRVDNNGFYLDNFLVLDAKKNTLKLSGKIFTKSFINPQFDVKLSAKNFRVLNATKEDNPSLYGIASFNASANLTGDLQIPKLSANITLGKETNVNYVLPTSYATVENRDNVVVFVNRKNPDAILTETEQQTATITGFDISTQLKIDKEAKVTVVIDEETGDNFNVSGDGDLIFNMLPNGNISLSGIYEISQGHYELNLYQLVNRKFLLAPGGRISWSGNPFDAKLDVKAIYKLETSASPLMAAQISNEDPSIKNKFKQVLPFNVYLNIDGELLQPKISFNLDMPEDQQGAIGGQVYSRVQQVNQQEEELNKQVFSLLVLNRFYPNSGSDGSSGGFATIARDNLNDAVSGQLNAFSDKILGKTGIELNFDLNSYTDYQGNSPTDRTQLGVTAQKKLFNERLTVRVGSDLDLQGTNATNQQTPVIGNVTLEYKITEDGRYRVKGFRKNEFENIIDGQTIVSGIALIFTQEFNEFNEMWNAIFRPQSQRDQNDKNEQDKKKNTVEKVSVKKENKSSKKEKE